MIKTLISFLPDLIGHVLFFVCLVAAGFFVIDVLASAGVI